MGHNNALNIPKTKRQRQAIGTANLCINPSMPRLGVPKDTEGRHPRGDANLFLDPSAITMPVSIFHRSS